MCSWISLLIPHQFCLNNLYCKINIFYRNILDSFTLKKTITIFIFNFAISSVTLSTRFDNEVAINLALSINFINIVTIFINLCNSFFYWNKRSFILFCISPKHSNFLSYLFANSFIIKWSSQFEALRKTTGIPLGTLSFRLQTLCVTPLYLSA